MRRSCQDYPSKDYQVGKDWRTGLTLGISHGHDLRLLFKGRTEPNTNSLDTVHGISSPLNQLG